MTGTSKMVEGLAIGTGVVANPSAGLLVAAPIAIADFAQRPTGGQLAVALAAVPVTAVELHEAARRNQR